MSYELKQTKNDRYTFNLKAANHQIILSSETYNSKSAALNGIKSVQSNGSSESNFELKTSSSQKPYFVLKAANGAIIGQSEMYNSEAAAKGGINSVIQNSSSKEISEV